MRAVTVRPGLAHSARLDDLPEPALADGSVLVRALALGVCGTDREIVAGQFGQAPPGAERIVLGHESLGAVLEAPVDSGLARGDHVVGIVRRPDPVPCQACAAGEWDMCRNGQYTERGIKQRDGYGAERFRIEPEFAVKVDRALGILGVLLEPASVVAKGFDHIERIGGRTRSWHPRTLLVTGAGPIGLLAALMGAQRGLQVHVLDSSDSGVKPALVRDLGATFHTGFGDLQADIVMECTGAATVLREALTHVSPAGVLCLVGISGGARSLELDFAGFNRHMVLDNETIFGTVNANRRHYEMGAQALAKADKAWLARLITRRVPLESWREIFEDRGDDIKVVLDFGALP